MTVNRKHEMGAEGFCVCPKCGEKTAHHRGIPCQDEHCQSCGSKLLREGSSHHQLFLQKQAEKDKGKGSS